MKRKKEASTDENSNLNSHPNMTPIIRSNSNDETKKKLVLPPISSLAGINSNYSIQDFNQIEQEIPKKTLKQEDDDIMLFNFNEANESTSSLAPALRRHLHIRSEQRRRERISDGFHQLRDIVPTIRGSNDSKASVLKKTVQYIENLEFELKNLKQLLEQQGQLNNQMPPPQGNYVSPRVDTQNYPPLQIIPAPPVSQHIMTPAQPQQQQHLKLIPVPQQQQQLYYPHMNVPGYAIYVQGPPPPQLHPHHQHLTPMSVVTQPTGIVHLGTPPPVVPQPPPHVVTHLSNTYIANDDPQSGISTPLRRDSSVSNNGNVPDSTSE